MKQEVEEEKHEDEDENTPIPVKLLGSLVLSPGPSLPITAQLDEVSWLFCLGLLVFLFLAGIF